MKNSSTPSTNFLQAIIEKDQEKKTYGGRVVTRFPPEPNGYLHLGHCKAICVNFGLAQDFLGQCHLRFDDTNPETEETEYVDSIKADVQWLGFDWKENLFYASDYFDQIYSIAEMLIEKGLAYVCNLSETELRQYRGDFKRPGKNSPFRDRTVAENLDLFRRMKNGDFADGSCVLRAKIDMQSPNMNMRDPLLYRIKKVAHHRTQDKWCIYPMYDFAHPLSDAIENITHSICTLEFQDHRPFYDWCVEHSGLAGKPKQYEFARLNITYLVMSKRKLMQLVKEKLVSGWNDPRMPTLSGARRRGYMPEALRNFAKRIGVSKAEGVIDIETLEACVKENLDQISYRAMAVLDPIKVTLSSLAEGELSVLSAKAHPKDESMGAREMSFGRHLFIERADFMETPNADFHRLVSGGRVRLRNAYVIECEKVIKDAAGNITELQCRHLPETLGGKPTADGVKVKGIIHWVEETQSCYAQVRIYERLFSSAAPEAGDENHDFKKNLNPNSLRVITGARLEKSLAAAELDKRYQFERVGYFCLDSEDSKPGQLVFNRIVEI